MAITVSNGDVQFPELLKTVRCNVDPEITRNSIARMRKTIKKQVLVEINVGAEAAELVKNELERSVGPSAKVRRLEDMSSVEIRQVPR